VPRSVSDLVKSALAGNCIRTAHLFRAVFTNSDTGQDSVYYFTDNFRDVEYDGNTYSALGHLLAYEGVEESSDFQLATVRCSLSAVDLNLVSTVLQYRYIDREMDIWRCFFSVPRNLAEVWNDSLTWDDYAKFADSEGADDLVDDPVKIFSGRMAEPVIQEDPDAGSCAVTLTASSYFADFDRRPGRHTNNSEQQAYFLGDRFFEPWGDLDQDVIWGRP